VAAGPGGTTLVAGYFQNTTDFGPGPLTSAGGYDGSVASLTP
jgi:hypothetical protein